MSDGSIMIDIDEAVLVCKLGKGSECCAFLTAGEEGFLCIKQYPPISTIILSRLKKGTINAKGTGGEGCFAI